MRSHIRYYAQGGKGTSQGPDLQRTQHTRTHTDTLHELFKHFKSLSQNCLHRAGGAPGWNVVQRAAPWRRHGDGLFAEAH